jgi:hypothetical protein
MTIPSSAIERARALQAATPRAPDAPPRRFAFLLPGEPLVCPHGHRMGKHIWALGSDAASGYRCQFRPAPTLPPCASTVFVLGMRDGLRVILDATPNELHTMESAQMGIAEMRSHLGLRWGA